MRTLKNVAAAVGAMSLLIAPVAASAAPSNPASALSISKASGVRAGSSMKKSSSIGGGAIFAIVMVAVVGATLGFAIDDDGSEPDSN